MITHRRYLRKRDSERIKKLIRKKGLTYPAIAELLGKSPTTIKNVVNGFTYSYPIAEGIERILGQTDLFPYLKEKREREEARRKAIEEAKKNLTTAREEA